MKPMKYCKDLGRFYTLDQWHAREVSKAWGALRRALLLWVSYKFRWVKALFKVRKLFARQDKGFAEKLEHWRGRKNLTVVTGDTTDPFKSHADGKYYTSKRKYRRELHARGYEEVGNDKQEHLKVDKEREKIKYDHDLKQEIARAIYD